MSDAENGGYRLPDEEPDLGEPVRELADLELEPSAGFLARIRGRIGRRLLASQLLELSWFSPILVFLEYLDLVFSALFQRRPRTSKETEE